jgi:hypothetical protein
MYHKIISNDRNDNINYKYIIKYNNMHIVIKSNLLLLLIIISLPIISVIKNNYFTKKFK